MAFDVDLKRLAIVNVSKSDINLLRQRLDLRLSGRSTTAGTAATHEHTEDVVHAAATATAGALLNTLQAVLVVDLTLFSVVQNIVGLLDLLEL